MKSSGATGRVKVTKIPRGEAPEEIRAAWVGLVLPCYPTVDEVIIVSGVRLQKLVEVTDEIRGDPHR